METQDSLKTITELLLEREEEIKQLKQRSEELKQVIESNNLERRNYEIAYSWDIFMKQSSNKEKARSTAIHLSNKLNAKLFGYRANKKAYSGLLNKWNNSEWVNAAHFIKLGNSIFCIPSTEEKFCEQIENIFRELKIPVRKMKLINNDLLDWRESRLK